MLLYTRNNPCGVMGFEHTIEKSRAPIENRIPERYNQSNSEQRFQVAMDEEEKEPFVPWAVAECKAIECTSAQEILM